jgi:hypothetical protein
LITHRARRDSNFSRSIPASKDLARYRNIGRELRLNRAAIHGKIPRTRARKTCVILSFVKIALNIPDELVRKIASEGGDPARVAIEALALDGYRTERLSESDVRQMLGFETRMEVHAFLKQHGVYLHYDIADLEQDRKTAERLRDNLQAGSASDRPCMG